MKFRAACVQLSSGDEADANLAAVGELVRAAKARGADFVATPENTLLMAQDREAKLARCFAEADDPALTALCALAAELGLWLLIGSVAVKVAADTLANRSLLLAPDGTVAARYDKIHLFDVDLPGERYRESDTVAPGDQAVTADLAWGRLGLSVCYDLRFPHLYRRLAKAGATILSVPAAFTEQTGRAHWHVLARARAIENGAFVIAPAQCGMHPGGRRTFGHSLIVSPWGEVLADGGDSPGVILAEIDLDDAVQARARIPSLCHDRDFS